MIYRYIRVSNTEQSEIRQRIAKSEHGIAAENIYMDKQSGRDFQHPHYQTLSRCLKSGNQICVTSIDWFGRNNMEIQQQWWLLTHEKTLIA